ARFAASRGGSTQKRPFTTNLNCSGRLTSNSSVFRVVTHHSPDRVIGHVSGDQRLNSPARLTRWMRRSASGIHSPVSPLVTESYSDARNAKTTRSPDSV